jgi:hypothetical protein
MKQSETSKIYGHSHTHGMRQSRAEFFFVAALEISELICPALRGES